MNTVWIFLMLMSGHMTEVGGFDTEDVCENTRKEIITQRAKIWNGREDKNDIIREYILTSYFETTKCFKVWKK